MENMYLFQNILYGVLIVSVLVISTLLSLNLYHLLGILKHLTQISQRVDRVTVLIDKEVGRLASFLDNGEKWLTAISNFLSKIKQGRSKKK